MGEEDDTAAQGVDLVDFLVCLSRALIFLGWLLVSVQTAAMCLAFVGKAVHSAVGVWSGVLVSVSGFPVDAST